MSMLFVCVLAGSVVMLIGLFWLLIQQYDPQKEVNHGDKR